MTTMNLNAGPITGNVGDVNSHNTVYHWNPGKERVELANWVSGLDFSQYHKVVDDEYTDGTLLWALQAPEYQTWLRDGGMLWAYGKPGAGKTTFASFVIKDLEEKHQAVVCYIYCRNGMIQKPYQLLAAILKQLILHCQTLNVHGLQNLKDKGSPLTKDRMLSELKDIFSKVPNVSIVIDALECIGDSESTRNQILEDLWSFTSVKVLITSRALPSIQYAMAVPGVLKLIVVAQRDDVRIYFQCQAKPNCTLGRLLSQLRQKDPDIENRIIDKIMEKADGMFLFAARLIDELTKETSPNGLLEALDTVPSEVIALYERTLKQIQMQDSRYQRLAFNTCSWILEALRPLKAIEIRHALAIGRKDRTHRMAEEDDLDDEVAVISSCAGLIDRDKDSELRFFHHTVQKFLQDTRTADNFLSATTIATTSLEVLSSPGIECDPPYLLTEYSASAWGPLVKRHESDEAVYELAVQQLAKTAIINILSRTCVGPAFKAYCGDYEGRCGATAIHIIAVYGLVRIGKQFITTGCINERDDQGRTALIWAASNGHLELVKELLGHASIEVTIRDKKYGLTPLLIAAEKGHVHVVNFLLDSGKIECSRGISSGRGSPLLFPGINPQTATHLQEKHHHNWQQDRKRSSGWTPESREGKRRKLNHNMRTSHHHHPPGTNL